MLKEKIVTENTEHLFRLALGLKPGQEVPAEVERAFLAFKKPYDRMGGGTISPQVAALIVMVSGVRVTAKEQDVLHLAPAPKAKAEKPKAEPEPKMEVTPAAPPEAPSLTKQWNGVSPGRLVKVVNRGVEVDAVFIGLADNGKIKVKIAGENEPCEVPADKVQAVALVEEF
ncbi:MAG: hypothetical protein ABIL09_07950 [Gemmatimonadota bacterium]